jgi:2,4'-dihydroxyacetophenone dioxygenase
LDRYLWDMQNRSATTHGKDLPWIPVSPGKSAKLLRFFKDDRGWTSLLRLEPGTVVARHRHTGETHAYTLEGQRRLESGEIAGPGDNVYEPTGNVDTWSAIGDVPLVVYVTVFGAVEYIDDDGHLLSRVTATSQLEAYRRHCEAAGITPLDLLV